MKLIISNVTRNNEKQLAAMVAVVLNCEVCAEWYVLTDTFSARAAYGYREVYDAYFSHIKIWDEEHRQKALDHVVSLPNPYENLTPEHYGFSKAQLEAENDMLRRPREVGRFRLTAECMSSIDSGLLFRLALAIGKTYKNVDITID
jgi:MoaA/NifB/PqqE/SkfB family radical SAM enzyme